MPITAPAPPLRTTLFKERYPGDWATIVGQYEKEEREAQPGKGHPMPHPDVYMREMYRNARQRWDRERRKTAGWIYED